MQIVIDIPEEDYIRLRDEGMFGNVTTFKRAVREGTPLPKGHGRLIDADELYDSLKFPTQQFASTFKQVLDDAPTIIEADRAESEGME